LRCARYFSAAEVVAAIAFAGQQDVEISVRRSGGHSVAGVSAADGSLMIDLSRLRETSGRHRPADARTGIVMDDNITIVKNAYEALAKRDIVTFLDTLAEHVEWHLPEHHPLWPGKAFVGPQAVLEGHLTRMSEIYDGFRIDLQRIAALGDTVLVEMRCRGRGKVTGQDLDVQAAQIWDLRDGKCVRWQEYLDTWQLSREMNTT